MNSAYLLRGGPRDGENVQEIPDGYTATGMRSGAAGSRSAGDTDLPKYDGPWTAIWQGDDD